MTEENRGRREVGASDDLDAENTVNVFTEPDDDLGFVTTIQDCGHDLENVAEYDPVDIQVKPHPLGYQIDYWYTDEEGKRKHGSEHLNPGHPLANEPGSPDE